MKTPASSACPSSAESRPANSSGGRAEGETGAGERRRPNCARVFRVVNGYTARPTTDSAAAPDRAMRRRRGTVEGVGRGRTGGGRKTVKRGRRRGASAEEGLMLTGHCGGSRGGIAIARGCCYA